MNGIAVLESTAFVNKQEWRLLASVALNGRADEFGIGVGTGILVPCGGFDAILAIFTTDYPSWEHFAIYSYTIPPIPLIGTGHSQKLAVARNGRPCTFIQDTMGDFFAFDNGSFGAQLTPDAQIATRSIYVYGIPNYVRGEN